MTKFALRYPNFCIFKDIDGRIFLKVLRLVFSLLRHNLADERGDFDIREPYLI